MTGVLLYGYLGGWMLTSSVAVFNATKARRSLGLSIVAGALWPVFALAVAQYVAIELIAVLSRATTRVEGAADDERHVARQPSICKDGLSCWPCG